MIPARSSAFCLVAALNPERLLDCLSANTLFLIVVFFSLPFGPFGYFICFPFFFWNTLNFLLFPLILSPALLSLINILFFQIVEHNSLQIIRIEEGSFSERSDVIRIDGSNLKSMLPQLDDFAVFRQVGYFHVCAADGIEKLFLVVHSLRVIFDAFEIISVTGIGLNQLNHFFPLLWWY